MRDPKPRKWITWEIPQKFLDDMTTQETTELCQNIREESNKALEDMIRGLQVSFKITNLPKEY